MKKITLLAFFILLLTSSTAFSQIDSFGLKFGGQSASAYSKQIEFSRVAGYGIYGFADIRLTSTLFSTIDLGYTQRGFTNSQIETDPSGQKIQTVEATSRLSYLSLSGIVNRSLATSFPLYIGAGPRIDYLIHTSSEKFEFTSVTVENNTANGLDDFVVGGSLIAGVKDLMLKSTEFRVEVKYEVDLTDSFSDTPLTYRNNAVMLVIGFTL